MKLCVDCQHNVRELWCQAPSNGISPVNGKPQVRFATMQRADNQHCGPEASFFESKQGLTEVSWWKRVFKWH